MTTTREDAARQLGVTVETVRTLVDQFGDAALYEPHEALITAAGMARRRRPGRRRVRR